VLERSSRCKARVETARLPLNVWQLALLFGKAGAEFPRCKGGNDAGDGDDERDVSGWD
jgi:hypothetical protein